MANRTHMLMQIRVVLVTNCNIEHPNADLDQASCEYDLAHWFNNEPEILADLVRRKPYTVKVRLAPDLIDDEGAG